MELSRGRDEISLLVEQEFLSLTKEHLILVQQSSEELEAAGDDPQETRELAPCVLAPLLVAGSSEYPGTLLTAGDRLQEQKVAMSIIGSSRQDCDSAMSTVTGILRAAKIRSAKGSEDGGHSLGDCDSEISKLLAHFPLKSTEMSKAPDNKIVLEETRVIKDFLQNSIFSGPGPREPTGLGPFLLLPPPPPPVPLDKLPELPAQKRQLPVFAKICSKATTEPSTEGPHLTGEWGWETVESGPARGRASQEAGLQRMHEVSLCKAGQSSLSGGHRLPGTGCSRPPLPHTGRQAMAA